MMYFQPQHLSIFLWVQHLLHRSGLPASCILPGDMWSSCHSGWGQMYELFVLPTILTLQWCLRHIPVCCGRHNTTGWRQTTIWLGLCMDGTGKLCSGWIKLPRTSLVPINKASSCSEMSAQSPKDTNRLQLQRQQTVHHAAIWQKVQKYPMQYHKKYNFNPLY